MYVSGFSGLIAAGTKCWRSILLLQMAGWYNSTSYTRKCWVNLCHLWRVKHNPTKSERVLLCKWVGPHASWPRRAVLPSNGANSPTCYLDISLQIGPQCWAQNGIRVVSYYTTRYFKCWFAAQQIDCSCAVVVHLRAACAQACRGMQIMPSV